MSVIESMVPVSLGVAHSEVWTTGINARSRAWLMHLEKEETSAEEH